MVPWVVSAVKLGASELMRKDMIVPRYSGFRRINFLQTSMSGGQERFKQSGRTLKGIFGISYVISLEDEPAGDEIESLNP